MSRTETIIKGTVQEAVREYVGDGEGEDDRLLTAYNQYYITEGWNEALKAIHWCLEQGGNFEGALAYIENHNPEYYKEEVRNG